MYFRVKMLHLEAPMGSSRWRFHPLLLLVLAMSCAHSPRAGWSPLPEVLYATGTRDVPAQYIRISPEGEVEAKDRRSIVLAPREGKLTADEEQRLRAILSRLPENARFLVEKAASARDQIQVNARIGEKSFTSDPNASEHPVLVEFALWISQVYQRIWNSADSR